MSDTHTGSTSGEGGEKNIEERLVELVEGLLGKSSIDGEIEKVENIERKFKEMYEKHKIYETHEQIASVGDLSEEYNDVIRALERYKEKLIRYREELIS